MFEISYTNALEKGGTMSYQEILSRFIYDDETEMFVVQPLKLSH